MASNTPKPPHVPPFYTLPTINRQDKDRANLEIRA